MTSDKNNSTDRQRDQESIELLRRLREKLLHVDISTARKAAHNLSWKQEDGLAILKEALFGDYPRTTKKAAAYGLRSMNGRMRQFGIEVLEQGLRHSDRTTKAACVKALQLMKKTAPKKDTSQNKKVTIVEIPQKKSTTSSNTNRIHPSK